MISGESCVTEIRGKALYRSQKDTQTDEYETESPRPVIMRDCTSANKGL